MPFGNTRSCPLTLICPLSPSCGIRIRRLIGPTTHSEPSSGGALVSLRHRCCGKGRNIARTELVPQLDHSLPQAAAVDKGPAHRRNDRAGKRWVANRPAYRNKPCTAAPVSANAEGEPLK